MPKYYYNIIQGTPEWFDIRKGKMTASHAQAIANQKTGLDSYIDGMMSELYSRADKEQFRNEHTDRGNELEEQAANIYAFNNEVELKTVGFVEHSEYAGCSPDRLVGDKGLLEIKCPDDKAYFQFLLKRERAIDTKYIWQMQMNLLITGLEWCDFVAYNPNYDESIFIYRMYPDKEKMKAIMVGMEMGEEKIKAIRKIINKI